jgi:hypothetical protein
VGLKIQVLAFVLGLLFFLVVVRNVKRNMFHPTYAVLWVGISLFLLSISVMEPVYKWVATEVIGIIDARHIIYIALIGFLLVYLLYLTAAVSRLSHQVKQLIGTLAILEAEATGRGQSPRQTPDPDHES